MGYVRGERKVEVRGWCISIARISQPVDRHVSRLKPHTRVIVDEAANPANRLVIVRPCQVIQPLSLRDGVIIDERDDVTVGHGDPNVARLRQITLLAEAQLYGIAKRREIVTRSVRRRPSNDTDLEIRILQIPQTR
ncbi:hypothetical protein GCM10008023_21310 [Sphingomonas glacialis]|uniref:Uncharacterized protein n=1 Tax=Sphingomonas glacialis TaxID=658225 RepID=A0ABQ3LJ20_9SPHN|nr:hypothetical protein GCM10008023_21310 [Sphingomonas glacialis]